MLARRLAAVPVCALAMLVGATAVSAKDVPEIPITVTPAPQKFKRTSTLKVKFNAPYNLGAQAVAETYVLNVLPPPRSECRKAEVFETAPEKVGDAIVLKVYPSDVSPMGQQRERWCEGSYRLRLEFEDPTSPDSTGPPPEGPPDESGPDDEYTADGEGYGVDVYELAQRKIKVR